MQTSSLDSMLSASIHGLHIIVCDETIRTKKITDFQAEFSDFTFSFIDSANLSSIGIDAIRELQQLLMHATSDHMGKNVFVLAEGEKLTLEAQNSLLKTLEEIPDNTSFLVYVPNISTLLPTVRSRGYIHYNGSTKKEQNNNYINPSTTYERLMQLGEYCENLSMVDDLGQSIINDFEENDIIDALEALSKCQEGLAKNGNTKVLLTELMLQL